MSVISNKLKQIITNALEKPKRDIEDSVNLIIKAGKSGSDNTAKVKDILGKMDGIEINVGKVDDVTKTIKSVLTSLKGIQFAAEASEKAATIGSALNPAAAAISVAQKFVVEGVKKEIKEAKDALNVAPQSIGNFKSFLRQQKLKLKRAASLQKRKKLLIEQRKRKLNS